MTTPSAKPEVPSSSQPKANAKPTAPAKHAPRSLDRLFNVDTSRALNVSLPTRYDPYYRFQDKPAVYAPYDPNVLEVMSKVGATAYSLTLSEDSRLWRLHELLHDPELMRQFMAMPRGWVVRLGLRGEEVEYNVEDLVNARLGITTPSVSSLNTEPIIPDPCNTPRPSTPFVNRNREFLKATISWAGMYDDLDAQELSSRPTRSQSESQTSRPGSSTSNSRPAGMTRTTSLDAGLSEGGRGPSTVWKTPFEDAVSKEDLGEMLDQQAARDKGKAKEVSARNTIAELDVGESEPEDDDDGPGHQLGRALFSPMASDDDEEEEEASSKVGTGDNSPFRPAPFRAWNDISSDEEDDEEVGKDKGKGKMTEKVSQEPVTGDRPSTPAPCEDSPWRPSPYRAWNDVSSDEEVEQADQGRPEPLKSRTAVASTISPTADRDVAHKANPSRILFKPSDNKSEQEGSTVTTLAKSLFKPCGHESTDEDIESDANLESGTVHQVLSYAATRHDLNDEEEDEGDMTEEDDMPADDRVPLVRHSNSRRNANLVPDEPSWSSDDDGDDEDGGSEDEVEEEEEEEEPQDREHIASALRAIFRSVNGGAASHDEDIGHGSMLVRSMFQREVEDSDSDSEDGQEDTERGLVSEQVGELAEARVSYVEAETSSDSEASEAEEEDESDNEEDTCNDDNGDDHGDNEDDDNTDQGSTDPHENVRENDDNDDHDSDRHDNDREYNDSDDHDNPGGSGGGGKDDRGDDHNAGDQNQDDAAQGDDENDKNDKDDKNDNKDDKNEKNDKNDRKGKAAQDDDGSEADDEQDGQAVEEEEEDDTILPDGVANIDDNGWRRIVTYTNGVRVFSGSKYWRWFPIIPNKIVTTPSFDLPPDSADEYELDDEPAEWYKGRTPPTPRWPPPKPYHGEKFNVCQYSESNEEYHSEDEHVPGPDAVCGRVKMEFHAKQLAEKLQRIEWWRGQTSVLKLSVNWAVRFGYRDPWL